MTEFRLRLEESKDAQAIHDLTKRAFEPMAFSQGDEADLITKLRDQHALDLSLVAVDEDDRVIGQVTFSPLRFDPAVEGDWRGLGPIAVEPTLQRKGIGSAMVKEALSLLASQGVCGIGLIGNPKVYGPMGFYSTGKMSHGTVPKEIVQICRLDESSPDPEGEMVFHPAFDD